MKGIACEFPRGQGLSLSRFSRAELYRLVIVAGCLRRLCLDDRPLAQRGRAQALAAPLLDLPHRPGLPGEGPGPVLELYQGRWQGKLLHSGEFVICAGEKTLDPGAGADPPAAACRFPARVGNASSTPTSVEARSPPWARSTSAATEAGARVSSAAANQGEGSTRRPARLAGDDQAALRLRAARLLDRRQRLLPARPKVGRAARAALAEPRPRPPAAARELAQPDRRSPSRSSSASRSSRTNVADVADVARTPNTLEHH